MSVRIDEDGALIVGNCALPAAVVPAVEEFFRERFAAEPSRTDEREWEYGITWNPSTVNEPVSYIGCETLEDAREIAAQLAYGSQTWHIWRRHPEVILAPATEWEVVPDGE